MNKTAEKLLVQCNFVNETVTKLTGKEILNIGWNLNWAEVLSW